MVARWAARLLAGQPADDSDPPLRVLGGRGADHLTSGALDLTVNAYWLRVWGARGLLYAWDDAAGATVVAGLHDEHWRVREMAAKVVRRREVGEAADAAARLVADGTPRVRTAAVRALEVVGEVEHADAVHDAERDEDEGVRRAARAALTGLRRRLDRDV